MSEDLEKIVKGAWDEMKSWLICGIICSIIGSIVLLIVFLSGMQPPEEIKSETMESVEYMFDNILETPQFIVPETWNTYEIHKAFKISVPPTVELRDAESIYSKRLDSIGMLDNDVVVFQQNGLSNITEGSLNRYCRIMIQHFSNFKPGELDKATKSGVLDSEMKIVLYEMALKAIAPQKSFIKSPTYEYVTIGRIKAIKTEYVRPGLEGNVHCCIFILQNDREMAQVMVSYRVSESDIWENDFNNIIKTFKWNQIY